jgi:hypothetical protein
MRVPASSPKPFAVVKRLELNARITLASKLVVLCDVKLVGICGGWDLNVRDLRDLRIREEMLAANCLLLSRFRCTVGLCLGRVLQKGQKIMYEYEVRGDCRVRWRFLVRQVISRLN